MTQASPVTGFRGVLIGCGFFADNHLHAWHEIEGATIVAVCDRDRGKAEAAALKHGIARVYDDAEARRKSRQGSETRDMNAFLRVRYHEQQLKVLSARAGKRLPMLIRQYADLLAELLPIADSMGVDPFELIRQTAETLLEGERQAHHRRAS